MIVTLYEAYTMGRLACFKGDNIDSNPFDLDSLEDKYWNDGFIIEGEYTRLLGIHFSAKREIEEEVKMQEEQIKTLKAQLVLVETSMDKLGDKVKDISGQRNAYEKFIRRLQLSPPRWARQYKNLISAFYEGIGL